MSLYQQIFERERAVLFPNYDRLQIAEVVSASGPYIHTADGKRYLDCVSGLGVNALGHSHPAVIAAVKEQAEKYLHLSNLYHQSVQFELAEMLCRMSGFERVFYSNSGAEAIEGALKLSRRYQTETSGIDKKVELVGLSNGFHGRTYGALSIMDKEKYKAGFGPFLPDAHVVGMNDVEGLSGHITPNTAAVIVEPIQGEGGITEITQEFANELKRLRELYHFLIISDEIQTGVGRTGKFFAHEHYGLEPDIVVCAKAIGGGLPLGAILTSKKISDVMAGGVHGTTFGGNALACAAGVAVLNELQNGLQDTVLARSGELKHKLVAIASKYPQHIKEVRGRGFMLGIEFYSAAKQVNAALLERGIISNVTNINVLRLLPPLIFEAEHIAELSSAIEEAVANIPSE
jgi:predicted acetylornithine/succinylornithine family transaminase